MLYTTINEKRCVVLHENDDFNVSTLFKLQDYKISQHNAVPLYCDETNLDSIGTYFLKKYGPIINLAENYTVLNFFRVQCYFWYTTAFPWLNWTIVGAKLSIESKMGFVTLQIIPYLMKSNHLSSKELMHNSAIYCWIFVFFYYIVKV